MKSLLHKSMMQFLLCTFIILILAAPLFYWLTKSFYAEDMIDIIEAVQRNEPIPELDLEEDIMQGVMIQYTHQRHIGHCHHSCQQSDSQTSVETF